MSSNSRPSSSTGNSRFEIELRQRNADYTRNNQRIRKNLKLEERKFNQNRRKLDSIHRGLLVLLGKDPYPGCTREDVLTEYNPPGFCFHRDGKSRFMPSLQESKTRKIVNDIDGHQGLRSDPAINVVSDTPLMAEVLSSSELVQILCELRNTSAIMLDETLFFQFSLALANSKSNPLVGFDGPMDYLKQYRKNLIQEFFDTLKTEAEMRLNIVPDDPTLSFFKEPRTFSNRKFGTTASTNFQSDTDGSNNSSNIQDKNLTVEQWNQAVIESLKKAQDEKIKEHWRPSEKNSQTEKYEPVDPDKDPALQWRIQRQMLGMAGVPSLYSSRAIGFDKYLEEHRKTRYLNDRVSEKEVHRDPTQLLFSNTLANDKKSPRSLVILAPFDDEVINKERIETSLTGPTPRVSFHPDTRDNKFKRQSRRDFDTFVKKLIDKIKQLDEMGRGLLAFQKKRPSKHENIIDPLLKLLKKQSLFSSLTDDDVLFYDFEEGRKGVEQMVAQQLSSSRPGTQGTQGTMLQVPSPVLQQDSSIGVSIIAGSKGQVLGGQETRPSTAMSTNRSFRSTMDYSVEDTEHDQLVLPSIKCEQGSMKKVHCQACREKVKLACEKMQKRDDLCKITKNAYRWTVAELSMWPKSDYRDISMSPRPPSVGESAGNLDFMRREDKSKSIYLAPPPKTAAFRKGATTPKFPRNQMLPPSETSYGLLSTLQSTLQSQRSFVPGKYTTSGFLTSGKHKNIGSNVMRPSTAFASNISSTDEISSGLGLPPLKSVESTIGKLPTDSWTLKVSKMDIMRLRHELETDTVKDKMAKFEEKYLNSL